MNRAFAALLLLGVSAASQAYVGPGTGLSALGALLAVLGTVAFAVVGLVWYPIKRLRRHLRGRSESTPPDQPGSGSD